MRIDSIRFAIGWAAAAAVLWLLCSAIVYLIPGPSMTMSGQMMHSEMGNWRWAFSFTGLLVGLIIWAVSAGLFGWLIAVVYNSTLQQPKDNN